MLQPEYIPESIIVIFRKTQDVFKRIEDNYSIHRIVEALINELVANKKLDEAAARNIIDIGRPNT